MGRKAVPSATAGAVACTCPSASTALPRAIAATVPTWRRSRARQRPSTAASTSPARARGRETSCRPGWVEWRTSASRPRPMRWQASPRRRTCAWSSSRSAPTTPASAASLPVARSTGLAAPSSTQFSACQAPRPALAEALPATERRVHWALAGVRQAMASVGYDRGGCPFWGADADWAAGVATASLDAAIQAAARALGACMGLLFADPAGDCSCRLEVGHAYLDGMRLDPLG